jgi:hypothetical protein
LTKADYCEAVSELLEFFRSVHLLLQTCCSLQRDACSKCSKRQIAC